MSIETFARACSLLSRMPSEISWSDGQAELYAVGMKTIPESIMMDVVTRAIATYRSRPTVADLLGIAAEIMAGPVPAPSDACDEVERLLTGRGVYCRQDPEHPNVYREGEPGFSHPLLAETVRRMGGWRELCTSEMELSEFRAQFRAAYEETLDRARRRTRLTLSDDYADTGFLIPVESGFPRRTVLRVSNGG